MLDCVVQCVSELLAKRVPGRPLTVLGAHMELAAPSIEDAVAQAAQAGITRLRVMPYMLSSGRHAIEDIPRMVHEACKARGIEVEVSLPLGVHELLAELVLVRAGLLPDTETACALACATELTECTRPNCAQQQKGR